MRRIFGAPGAVSGEVVGRPVPRTILLIVLVALVAACGGTANPTTTTLESTTTTAPTTTTSVPPTSTTEVVAEDFPVTIEANNGPVTIESRPERIVSISPTGTEMLFAIGAGLQVIAVDDLSYFPADTPLTDLSAFTPNLEAILAFEPDLVVASYDPENVLSDGLGAVGVPLILFFGASTIDDVYSEMRALGSATGNLELAEKVSDEISADLDSIVAEVDGRGEGITYLHDAGFPWVTSSFSFVGEIYSLFGLVNIADTAPGAEFGFLELSDEYVVDSDPQLIFLSFDDPSAPVSGRPGWSGVSAVVNDAVIVLDPDTSSRWGPRIVDFARDIADALLAHAEES